MILSPENKTIRSLWIGRHLSPVELLCLKSFLHHGHTFELYTYKKIQNLPKDVILRDANEVLPFSEFEKIREKMKKTGEIKAAYAIFADFFRYKLLFEYGGWWSDVDVVCLRPFDIEQTYVFGMEKKRNGEYIINNAIMKCPPRSEIMQFCFEFVANRFSSGDKIFWGETGSGLLDPTVRRLNLIEQSFLPERFAPISWFEIDKFFLETELSAESYSLHLFNQVWAAKRYNRYGIYDQSSVFEKLKSLYGVKNSMLACMFEYLSHLVKYKVRLNRK